MEPEQLRKYVSDEIDGAIDRHKSRAIKKIKHWSGSLSAVFAFLLLLGFTTSDLVNQLRRLFVPPRYLAEHLTSNLQLPAVQKSFSENVWKTLATDDKQQIKRLLKNSVLDEVIVDSYYTQITQALFSHQASDKSKRIKTILKLGGIRQNVLIGEYKNSNSALTNCSKIFRQNKRRLILFIPNNNKNKTALPWFNCPQGYPSLIAELQIEDVYVGGVLVIGVERPIDSTHIQGVRARVTHQVAEQFKVGGIDLGEHITSGYIRVTDAF